ncbi:MAG TPA: hypothetical protein VFK52_11110 [Nocardioidaceae bacterium]|nr:hypothetical protein [Nocardioidaceae bacterium]
MDTLQRRLDELAEGAPTGGAPAAELWARGRRVQRYRTATLTAAALVVATVSAGIGLGLSDEDRRGSEPAPATPPGITLPIEYPQSGSLPELGDAPGHVAAVWLSPGDVSGIYATEGGEPEVVAFVAETATFGTLPIDVSFDREDAFDTGFALSPDGRRMAYTSRAGELVVHDLVTGDRDEPAFDFGFRAGYTWVDATHLVGHVAGGSDTDGWVWEPGTTTTRVNLSAYPGSPWLGTNAGIDPWYVVRSVDHSCQPSLRDREGPYFAMVLCDVVGVIGTETVITHDGNGRVVAVSRPSGTYPFEDPMPSVDPPLRDVVDTAGAGPLMRVRLATGLIAEALDAGEGGAS